MTRHRVTRVALSALATPVVRAVLVGALALTLVPAAPASAAQAGTAGSNDDITDVGGITVGNYTNTTAMTGTTVVYATSRATAGVDVRSGTPITRETDLLSPVNEVQHLNAVLLTGGGDYGLAAGPGVMQWLEDQGIGYPVGLPGTPGSPAQVVPIVPGAAINDLGNGGQFGVRPDNSYGYNAINTAAGGPIPQGNVGAGAGAIAGGLKGGLGSASQQVTDSITGQSVGMIGALVIVNSSGTPVDAGGGCRLLGAEFSFSSDLTNYKTPPAGCGSYVPPARPSSGPLVNRGGVIGVVATDINLDKALSQKMAQVAQDGITRAIDPAHTMFDGDVVFGLSTGQVNPTIGGVANVLPDCIHQEQSLSDIGCLLVMNDILAAAHDVMSRAITHAMLNARSAAGFPPSYCAQFQGACPAADSAPPPTTATHAAVPSKPSLPRLPKPPRIDKLKPSGLPQLPGLPRSGPSLASLSLVLLLGLSLAARRGAPRPLRAGARRPA